MSFPERTNQRCSSNPFHSGQSPTPLSLTHTRAHFLQRDLRERKFEKNWSKKVEFQKIQIIGSKKTEQRSRRGNSLMTVSKNWKSCVCVTNKEVHPHYCTTITVTTVISLRQLEACAENTPGCRTDPTVSSFSWFRGDPFFDLWKSCNFFRTFLFDCQTERKNLLPWLPKWWFTVRNCWAV